MSDDQTLANTDTPITDEQVADYLRKHADFFVDQPSLLADLNLPHASGQAISLVERQVSVLRERNMDMRHRLSKLLDNARENDRLFEKTKRLVLALLESHHLKGAIDALLYSFNNDFKIHYTSVIFFGEPDAFADIDARIVSLNDARENIGSLIKANKPQCGVLTPTETKFLFPEDADNIGSVAMVPLMFGNTFGVLSMANRDDNYYRSSMGTLFLNYIGEVLNRQLPPLMPR